MKSKDIAVKYGIDKSDFESFVTRKNLPYTPTFTSIAIEDSDVDAIVKMYKEAKKKALDEQTRCEEEAAAEAQRKSAALANMIITSGFSFDGFTITKYSGYISGDDAVSVERGMALFGSGKDVKDDLMASLVTIRRNALRELKEAAYALGCNAVIGVDFDYLTLDPQTASIGGGTTYMPYIFGVTANGNAVVIEKNTAK